MESDPVLLWLLRHAGDEWGPLHVALSAIDLTDRAAVLRHLEETGAPAPIEDPEDPAPVVDPPVAAPVASGNLPGNTVRPSYVPENAKRVFLADARTGRITPLGLEAAGGPGRVKFQDGWFVVSLHPGDMASGIKSRTELKAYPKNVAGINLLDGRHVTVFDQEFPIGFKKATSKTQRGEVIVMQMHGPNANDPKRYQGPILSMRTEGGQLEIVHQHYRDSSKTWLPGVIHSEPIQEGTPIRWGFDTVFAEKNGQFKIWRNDKLIKTVPGYTYNEGVRAWLGPKWGVYDVVYNVVTIRYGNMAVYKVA